MKKFIVISSMLALNGIAFGRTLSEFDAVPEELTEANLKGGVFLSHHSRFTDELKPALLNTYCNGLNFLEKGGNAEFFGFERSLRRLDCKPSKALFSEFPYGPWFLLDDESADIFGIIHLEPLQNPDGAVQMRGRIFRFDKRRDIRNRAQAVALEFENLALDYLHPAYISLFRRINADLRHGPKLEVLSLSYWEVQSWRLPDGREIHSQRTMDDFSQCTFNKSKHPSLKECQEQSSIRRRENWLFGALTAVVAGGMTYALKDKIHEYYTRLKRKFFGQPPRTFSMARRNNGNGPKHDLGRRTHGAGELLFTAEEEQEIERSEKDVVDHEQYVRTREQQLQREREQNGRVKSKETKTGNSKTAQKPKTQVSHGPQLPMKVSADDIWVTENFLDQFESLPETLQKVVRARILQIYGSQAHYGDKKAIDGCKATFKKRPTLAFELRFTSGMRIYFVVIGKRLLFDRIGNKKTQEKDIEFLQRAFCDTDLEKDMDELLR